MALLIAVSNSTSNQFTGRIHAASADVAGSRPLGDDDGHGTNVAQILLGAKDNSGTHGVAFNSTLLALRADTPGSCTTTNTDPELEGCEFNDNAIARGIDVAVNNGAKVINISLGGSPANATLRNAISRATTSGVIIVFSAGNEYDTDPATAINPDPLALIATETLARGLVVIAGAVKDDHTIAAFSNRAGTGANFYLTALGDRVCCVYENGVLKRSGSSVFVGSGTSFSAPVITGAIALLSGAFPTLTPTQIVDLLLRTADDLGAAGIDSIYGRGELNIQRAFQPQGQTALAGSMASVSLATNGTTSAPMGDASQGGLAAVVLDEYGRAFDVELGGTIRRAPISTRLAPGLALGSQTIAATVGRSSVALSVANGRVPSPVEVLNLSDRDQRQARAVAGSIITRLSKDTRLAIGISRGGSSLVDQLAVRRAASFLAAEAASDGFGFTSRPGYSFAYHHKLGGVELFGTGEIGQAREWQRVTFSPLHNQPDDRGYSAVSFGAAKAIGPAKLSGRLTQLTERKTVLGSNLGPFLGNNGGQSWFADVLANVSLGQRWQLGLAWRQGWTKVAPNGIRLGNDFLRTNAWSADVMHTGITSDFDSLSLRVSQPLRVSRGGLNLTLPSSYDYADGSAGYDVMRFNLAPTGRERDVEAVYSLPLSGGVLTANGYWRVQPGNYRAARDDVGTAIRFSLGF